ncbi:MAG TPA: 3-dehydroquinate synthase [Bryobacteraceae bacterium]|nr:3-dehydroquinate synthase [Bryobacteraceae bacterium]
MRLIQQTVRAEFHYPVHFTRDAFRPDNQILRNVLGSGNEGQRRILFVVDKGVCTSERQLLTQIDTYCHAHAEVIQSVAASIVIPGGEVVKNSSEYVDIVRDAVNVHHICRHSFVIAIGGGAVLDMVGYAAATSHRGVRLIRMPTTVLAQNDSGVGVKNGVNLYGKKNFLGTFAPPFAVINDLEFLESLSDRDWRSGLAEAVKVGLIKDAAFFEYLEATTPSLAHRGAAAMEHAVYRCAELHLEHIRGADPFESGSSRPLDFGHWAAHRLEQLTLYRLRHGEAVAIGIALDATYSHLVGMLSEPEWSRIINILLRLGFSLYVPELECRGVGKDCALLDGLSEFREHLGGQLTIMLLEGIGRGVEVHNMHPGVIARSAAILRHLARERSISHAV